MRRRAPRFESLRTFAEFWVDQGRAEPCCQFASDADLASDPEEYNCDRCVVADALAGLDAENAKAWRLFQYLQRRFVVEQQALGSVLDRMTRDEEPEQFEDTLSRLSLLYDVMFPKKAEPDRA